MRVLAVLEAVYFVAKLIVLLLQILDSLMELLYFFCLKIRIRRNFSRWYVVYIFFAEMVAEAST